MPAPRAILYATTVRVIITVLVIIFSLPLLANSTDNDNLRIQRLYSLTKLWGPITYFHPYLAYKPINFDSAFAAAVIKIDTAQNRETYVNAIKDMLSCLDDPITDIVSDTPTATVGECEGAALETRWADDSVLVVTVNEACLSDYMAVLGKAGDVTTLIDEASAVIFDLRFKAADYGSMWVVPELITTWVPSLLSTSVYEPGLRSRMYSGYPDETGQYSKFYTSSFSVTDGREIKPAEEGSGCPAVFVVNELTPLPPDVYALQQTGTAAVLAVGEVSPAGFDAYHVSLADDLVVSIRTSEILHQNGSVGLQPTKAVPASTTTQEIFEVATELLTSGKEANLSKEKPVAVGRRFDTRQRFSEPAYPNLGYRILAAAKMHYIIDNFFAYRDLMNEDWDSVLKTFIPRFAAARDSLEYALTVAEMYTYTNDGHSSVSGDVLSSFYGSAAPPILVRTIEGKPVITALFDDSLCHAAGIQVGDVITEIDGVSAAILIDSLKRYTAASNRGALDWYLSRKITFGPDSSTMTLTVKGKDNKAHAVQLPRLKGFRAYPYLTERFKSDTIRILDGNIGYVDLDRLAMDQVDLMFDTLKDTRAIIFDMRGYPWTYSAFGIPQYLTREPKVAVAHIETPLVFPPTAQEWSLPQGSRTLEKQLSISAGNCRYEGMTVMLIDSRSQSSSEHVGLYFESVNGTKFIGTPSAGANGDVTGYYLPGGLKLRFTGVVIRHADGRQLQQIGLVPDVEVKPTIDGIRAGKDEILQAAIKYLNDALANQ